MIRIGTILYGYCGGAFGDSYENKRIEVIGADYVVARDTRGNVHFYEGDPEALKTYTAVIPSDDEDEL